MKKKIKEFVNDNKDGKRVRIIIKPSRNSATLASFCLYCSENPSERFWQALRNWSCSAWVLTSNKMSPDLWKHCEDTFYREGRLE